MQNEPETKRIHERLTSYWHALRGDTPFPKESEVDPDDISDIWDDCFLIKFDGKEFKYSYLGASLVKAYGVDSVDSGVVSHLIDEHSKSVDEHCRQVMDLKLEVIDEGEFTNKMGMQIKHRSVYLPLGTAPDTVEYILGAMRWKAC